MYQDIVKVTHTKDLTKIKSSQPSISSTGKSFAFPSWILIHNPWVERLKSTLGILMWFAVSTVIAYHIGIVDQNPTPVLLDFYS